MTVNELIEKLRDAHPEAVVMLKVVYPNCQPGSVLGEGELGIFEDNFRYVLLAAVQED